MLHYSNELGPTDNEATISDTAYCVNGAGEKIPLMKKIHRGYLIAIEGIDGAGKSSLMTAIAALLTQQQLPVLLTREPGGTPLGQQLRQILQHRQFPVCPTAEYLLFAADRAEHFNSIVLPNLAQNKIVISDRMGDSSLVYQGFGRGLPLEKLALINRWAMGERQPDLVLYLRLDPAVANQRIQQRVGQEAGQLSSFEQEQASFRQQVAQGFDTVFHNRPDVFTLDGAQAIHSLAQQAYNKIITQLGQL